jgi:hypothetical protein
VSYYLSGRGPTRRWNGHSHMLDLSVVDLASGCWPPQHRLQLPDLQVELPSPRATTPPSPSPLLPSSLHKAIVWIWIHTSRTESHRPHRRDPGPRADARAVSRQRHGQGARNLGLRERRGEGRGLPDRRERSSSSCPSKMSPPRRDLTAPGRHLTSSLHRFPRRQCCISRVAPCVSPRAT